MGRPNASDHARRLLALLPHLSVETPGEEVRLSLRALARAVGETPETVAADIAVLALCGTDQYDPGALVSVFVEGDAVIVAAPLPALERPVRLTPAEARALTTALEGIGVGPDSALTAKLAAVAAHDPDLEGIARTVRADHAADGQAAKIAALEMAAVSGHIAAIAYVSTAGGASTRSVHPYALYRWRGSWYLLAHCESAGEQRTFRLDRIGGVRVTERTFERPEHPVRAAEPLPDLDALPRAIVRFDRAEPDLTDRDWPGATFETRDDGSVLASVPYAGTAWIARKVAARLGEAEVIGPAEVRAAVAATARGLLAEAEGTVSPGSGG